MTKNEREILAGIVDDMVGGYTTDKWGDKAYLFSVVVIDGSLAMNNEGEDEDFVCPAEICVEATNEDTQFFFLKLMKKSEGDNRNRWLRPPDATTRLQKYEPLTAHWRNYAIIITPKTQNS